MGADKQSRQTMRILTKHTIATAAAALIALTTFDLQPASAGWRHSDEAVALGVFGAVLGTIAGVIAAEHAHEQPVFVPVDPYKHSGEPYAHGWRHRPHFHDHDRWHYEER
jgi:hypothetical protein